MSEPTTSTSQNSPTSAWLQIAIGCALFGILMSVRHEVQNHWLRAVVAAIAGFLLVVVLARAGWVFQSPGNSGTGSSS